MRLDENKQLFRQAISAASNYFKIEPSIVEKDYYITIFLERLSKRIPTLLFKGGTSLSKCYNIICRFSEDIDLTLLQDTVTQGQRKKLKQMIKETCSELNLTLLNEAETKSRRDFNRYEIDYSQSFPGVAIKPVILVETTFIVKSYPAETKDVTSIIYDYMASIHMEDLAAQYELTPFTVSVQTLERTLIDKIFALCDYYLTDNISSHSRHIYDINKLLGTVRLDDDFDNLFNKVREERKSGNSQCVSAKDEYNITDLLREILASGAYEEDYHKITEHVLYEHLPYNDAVNGIRTLIERGLPS